MRSTSSPKSSMRTGSAPVVGKTSTMSPRTASCAAVARRARRARSRPRRALDELVARRAPRRAPRARRGPRRSGGGTRSTSASTEIATRPPARSSPSAARALADEVRRRLEARAVRDAARRHEADLGRGGVPGRPRRRPRARVVVVAAATASARRSLASAARQSAASERREQRLRDARRGDRGGRRRRARPASCATPGCAAISSVTDARVGEAENSGAVHEAFGRDGRRARRQTGG